MNRVYNIDCMEAMQKIPDKWFDLAVVDPPYFFGSERRGYYGNKTCTAQLSMFQNGKGE